jgi:hypothetical protein
MGIEITPQFEGTLKTSELQARMELDLGLIVSPITIRAWIDRDEHPLPVAYRGKNGQAHRFRWLDFLTWYEAEQERTAAFNRPDADDIDQIDWHTARTISARERAKKDILETRRLEGKYAEVTAMERAAEDRARHAVNQLRAISSRLAPVLVGKDELEIDRLLDAEIRTVCAEIERAALAALDADGADDPLPEAAA